GLRYELLDGTLLVRRAPRVWHQEVAFALARALHAACPPDLHVVLVEVGCPSGAHIWQAQWPFPVDICPADLVAGLCR
ncbi:MAG: hypothetical protein JO287_10885, partial [Pseudonocardiales bacterium]|nr:hypothetical protein [Pseudonocardiales bacterium]